MTNDADNQAMEETMNEIEQTDGDNATSEVSLNKRENLQTDITNLEKNIVEAQKIIDQDQEESTYTPVSPEQANENKKKIVFLKKDLESKKSEVKSLDE